MNISNLFNRRVLLGGLIIALMLTCIFFVWILVIQPNASTAPESVPAALTLIPAPTSTVYVTLTPTLPPLLDPNHTPSPEDIAVGLYVQITGTEGQGLRIRATAGLSGEPRFLGFDSEVFLVKEGPQIVDGYNWWYLVAPYDEARAGWAAANFLTVIQNP